MHTTEHRIEETPELLNVHSMCTHHLHPSEIQSESKSEADKVETFIKSKLPELRTRYHLKRVERYFRPALLRWLDTTARQLWGNWLALVGKKLSEPGVGSGQVQAGTGQVSIARDLFDNIKRYDCNWEESEVHNILAGVESNVKVCRTEMLNWTTTITESSDGKSKWDLSNLRIPDDVNVYRKYGESSISHLSASSRPDPRPSHRLRNFVSDQTVPHIGTMHKYLTKKPIRPASVDADSLDVKLEPLFNFRHKLLTELLRIYETLIPSSLPGTKRNTLKVYTPANEDAIAHRRDAIIALFRSIGDRKKPSDERFSNLELGPVDDWSVSNGEFDPNDRSDSIAQEFSRHILGVLSTHTSDDKIVSYISHLVRFPTLLRVRSVLDYIRFWMICDDGTVDASLARLASRGTRPQRTQPDIPPVASDTETDTDTENETETGSAGIPHESKSAPVQTSAVAGTKSESKDADELEMPSIKRDLLAAIRKRTTKWMVSWDTTNMNDLGMVWCWLYTKVQPLLWSSFKGSTGLKTQIENQLNTSFPVDTPLSADDMVDTLITTTLPNLRTMHDLNHLDQAFKPIRTRLVEETIAQEWKLWLDNLCKLSRDGKITEEDEQVGLFAQVYNTVIELHPEYEMESIDTGLGSTYQKYVDKLVELQDDRVEWMTNLSTTAIGWISNQHKEISENPDKLRSDRVTRELAGLLELRRQYVMNIRGLYVNFKPSHSPELYSKTRAKYNASTLVNAITHRREAIVALLSIIGTSSFRVEFPTVENDRVEFMGGPSFANMPLGPIDPDWTLVNESFKPNDDTSTFRDEILKILRVMYNCTDITDANFNYLKATVPQNRSRTSRRHSLLDYVLFWLICPGDMRKFQNNVNFLAEYKADTTYGASNVVLYNFALQKYEDLYNPKLVPAGIDPLQAEIEPDKKVLYMMDKVSNGRAYTPMRSMRKLIQEFKLVPNTRTEEKRENASKKPRQRRDRPGSTEVVLEPVSSIRATNLHMGVIFDSRNGHEKNPYYHTEDLAANQTRADKAGIDLLTGESLNRT